MPTNSSEARTIALKKRGLKQTCENDDCGRRFYDLMRTSLTCPYCGTTFDPPPPPKTTAEIMSMQYGRKKPVWIKPAPAVVEAEPVAAEASETAPAEADGLLLELEDESEEPAIETEEDEADADEV